METKLVFECIDQELSVVEDKMIASGGRHENVAKFFFCSKWDGFQKTAVFYRNESNVFHAVINTNNECEIPNEVTNEEGTFLLVCLGFQLTTSQRHQTS